MTYFLTGLADAPIARSPQRLFTGCGLAYWIAMPGSMFHQVCKSHNLSFPAGAHCSPIQGCDALLSSSALQCLARRLPQSDEIERQAPTSRNSASVFPALLLLGD